MRATSARRKEAKPTRYRGAVAGTPATKKTHDYDGDGPSFICERCGAKVASIRAAHARGGGKSKGWSRCGSEMEVASDLEAAEVDRAEAKRRGWVTKRQIARRFNRTERYLAIVNLPDPVGLLANRVGQAKRRARLYDAIEVEQYVRSQHPLWLRQPKKGSNP